MNMNINRKTIKTKNSLVTISEILEKWRKQFEEISVPKSDHPLCPFSYERMVQCHSSEVAAAISEMRDDVAAGADDVS